MELRQRRPSRPQPKGLDTKATWQAQKADTTRTHILEVTLRCLAELPYSEVTTSIVSDRAGVSRGGMQYHFPTRLNLLQAAVDRLYDRRLQAYRTDLAHIPPGTEITDHIVDTYWQHLNEPDFSAYQELVLAARSNPELKQALLHHYRDFLLEWHTLSRDTFGWEYTTPEVMRLGTVCQFLMDGMAYGQVAGQLTEDETQGLLNYAKSLMREGMERGKAAAVA
jgi:AcrR family transcriptional regulator